MRATSDSRTLARTLVFSALAAALGACAWLPLQIDRGARAPAIQGFGGNSLALTSASPEARRLFDQGMAQAYAFNEDEAVRAFKAALAQDPACAMCAWGVAWQLGPNINDGSRAKSTEARRYAAHAVQRAAGLSERDRALVDAMAVRYAPAADAREAAVLDAPVCGAGGGGKTDPLDLAYAARLRALAARWPADPDVVSLYAEAEMIATSADVWWDPATGAPAGRIGEMTTRIETALTARPDHVGLNHYLIHAVDALPVASRAELAADRLAGLAPASPHLLHMPAHTYLHLGRYADASGRNMLALGAEDALDADLKKQGFAPVKDWRGHNANFLWYAALMEGRGDVAMQVARQGAAKMAGAPGAFPEYVRSAPSLTLMRLERWDDLLKEPMPTGDKGVATVLGEYAHGVALARTGRGAQAGEALARLEPAAATLLAAHAGDGYLDRMLRGIAEVAQERLRAEVAGARQRPDDAIAHQLKALAAGKDIDQAEPPTLAAGNRLALGDLQLKAKRWADAEQSFRTDLAEHPKSGWAMKGLAQSLRGQGRTAEAEALRADLDRVWAAADAGLRRLN